MSYILFVGDLFGVRVVRHRKIGHQRCRMMKFWRCNECFSAHGSDVATDVQNEQWCSDENSLWDHATDPFLSAECFLKQWCFFKVANYSLLNWNANCVLDQGEILAKIVGQVFVVTVGIEIGFACICPSPSNNHASLENGLLGRRGSERLQDGHLETPNHGFQKEKWHWEKSISGFLDLKIHQFTSLNCRQPFSLCREIPFFSPSHFIGNSPAGEKKPWNHCPRKTCFLDLEWAPDPAINGVKEPLWIALLMG